VKILLNIFEKVKPVFTEGGKLAVMKPLYEAMENFFFAPSEVTLASPFGRDAIDLKRYMSMVIIGLMPCVLAAWYFFGLRVLAMIMVSYMAGGVVEVAFAVIRKEPIAEGFLVTGLIFPLVLPPTLPLWMVAVGVMVGVFIGKELFGGTGRNLFNPAILGRCFLALAYPRAMSDNWIMPAHGITGRLLQYIPNADGDLLGRFVGFISNSKMLALDAVAQATPLGAAKAGELAEVSHLVLGEIAGSIGETSGFLIICGGIFLLLTRVANWRTVAGSLIAAFVMAAIFYRVDNVRFAPATWHLFAGGLLFGSFFMATDPVSSPITNAGKWIYGILIGVITMLIRNFTGYVEGVTFAILLGNIVAPVLDEMIYSIRIRRLASEG
jgi:Na(+)-translocating NADH:ubiquinone oxidoreductase B subunit